mmetsp:Transcript_40285/g.96578  ORF Transcript_40285/g.96578 Transcript_40285/m.96578 type:complete len:220 (+) Transcript_40285:156-815(+)
MATATRSPSGLERPGWALNCFRDSLRDPKHGMQQLVQSSCLKVPRSPRGGGYLASNFGGRLRAADHVHGKQVAEGHLRIHIHHLRHPGDRRREARGLLRWLFVFLLGVVEDAHGRAGGTAGRELVKHGVLVDEHVPDPQPSEMSSIHRDGLQILVINVLDHFQVRAPRIAANPHVRHLAIIQHTVLPHEARRQAGQIVRSLDFILEAIEARRPRHRSLG